eukprot:TRINITY_DN2558_c0_g3_i1.p1 TRINITY_DN2558_c0_g3~~TRINITY_DN2558_c0_g3_i1.p1  ORF type:complete len:527 (+),score=160.28 TRINITY_DN2558_c0_g3_i1:364-1944(+)
MIFELLCDRTDDYTIWRKKLSKRLNNLRKKPRSFFIEIEVYTLLSERACAYSMCHKATVMNNPRANHDVLSRMKKAVKWSSELKTYCLNEEQSTEAIKEEAKMFHEQMQGFYELELKNYDTAFKHLSNVKQYLDKTSKTMFVKAIDPAIKFCRYYMEKSMSSDDIADLVALQLSSNSIGLDLISSNLNETLTSKRLEKAKDLKHFEWTDGTVVDIATPELAGSLLLLKERQEHLTLQLNSIDIGIGSEFWFEKDSKKQLFGLFDQLFGVIPDVKDALIVAQARSTVGISEISALLERIELESIIRRDFLLVSELRTKLLNPSKNIESSVETADICRLYEQLLQGIGQLRNIITEVDKRNEVTALQFYTRAVRTYFVGLTFFRAQKFEETVAMITNFLKVSKLALTMAKKGNLEEIFLNDLQKLQNLGEKLNVRCRSLVVLCRDNSQEKEIVGDIKKLNVFKSTILSKNDCRIVDWPPKPKIVYPNPIFMDNAFSFVDYPDISDIVEQVSVKKPSNSVLSKFLKKKK